MRTYVKKHNFGYDAGAELPINKISLRNLKDLQEYIDDVVRTMLKCEYKNNVITFLDDNTKVKINIKK